MNKRWKIFHANKRGRYSLYLFAVLFILSLAAELIANDKPVLMRYDGHLLSPALRFYPETRFGGDFETEADYRDPYVAGLIRQKGWMVWPLIPYDYTTINYDSTKPSPASPDRQNWLGTDDQGRDVLARLIYGFRISVLFGLVLTVISSVIGVLAGAVQGYFGGWTDLLLQRFMEVWGGMPTLYILIILSSLVQPDFWWLLGLMLLFSWMALVGVVRAEVLKARKQDYVKAAHALGVKPTIIMLRHIVPNALVAALSMLPFLICGAIISLTSLDFLGLGLPPGAASLGELLSQGKNNPQAPWLGLAGFLVLGVSLSLLVFIGEAARDAFNPRKQ